MKIITISLAILMWLLPQINLQAQEVVVSIEYLETSKEKIIKEEKAELKKEVKNINSKLEANEIDQAQADDLKAEAAQKHALNIENRIAIIDNKIALLERNSEESGFQIEDDKVTFSSFEDGDYVSVSIHKHRKYDLRTTSGLLIAFGFNNLITEDESFSDTQIKIGGSRFFEIGWVWKTRVFKDSNWLRLKYGFSFSWDGLKPEDNQYFVDNGDVTVLEVHPQDLDKAKLRVDKLLLPLHFEFGPSRKKEYPQYFRYSTFRQFKAGIGGFVGFKLGSRQKLKYEVDGSNKKEKIKASYNTNAVVYGLSGYIGWGWTSLYARYEINPIFKDNPIDQHNISMGLRFDI